MLSVHELNRDQLDELKSNYFWSDEFTGCNGNDGLPVLFPGDIPDAVILEKFEGISFVPDDFSCTAGKSRTCTDCVGICYPNMYPEIVFSDDEHCMEAEATVARIKNSNEWKRAYNYFSLQKTRGTIKEKPTKENGYQIELYESADLVSLDDLSGIVTSEQMEQIKALLSK